MSTAEPEPAPEVSTTGTAGSRIPLKAEVFPNGVGVCAVALSGTMVGLHTIFHVQYTFKGAAWRHPGEYLPAVLLASMLAFVWAIVWLLSPNTWVEHGILQDRYRKGTRFIWLGFVLLLIGVVFAIAISFEPVRDALGSFLPRFQWMSLPGG